MFYNVLIVDDNNDFREEFRECFKDDKNYNILEASRGQEALELLKKPNEIDLVILDVMLPDLCGTDVLKIIKKTAPDLIVVILTGYGSKNIVIEALKGHADYYIEKPLCVVEAKKAIDNLLDAKKGKYNINIVDIEYKIIKVKRFIERNYDKKVGLKTAASIVCLSPKYLSRIFKQSTGIGFCEYRLNVKIEKAKDFLNQGEYNINQIAYKLGYNNTDSFQRQFKRLTGITPSKYRKTPLNPNRVVDLSSI